MKERIQLYHGDGGVETNTLIQTLFYKHFDNELLIEGSDASIFEVGVNRLAYTTDSFVVKPLIFPGGDIGKLAICGTINDLVVAGAKPLYLSCGMIIEEGLELELLEQVVKSMAQVCRNTGVNIVTGDTKVVDKGDVDQLFINTSGIGIIEANNPVEHIEEGDQIIVTGGIGEHGTVIAVKRYQLDVKNGIKSDCMPLTPIMNRIKDKRMHIKLMKDPTRGGVATALNEMAYIAGRTIHINEKAIPIKKEILSVSSLLGIDPLYLACEGRMLLVARKEYAQDLLQHIRSCKGCEDAQIIGCFKSQSTNPVVYMQTYIGGKRILGPLEGGMLPRIC